MGLWPVGTARGTAHYHFLVSSSGLHPLPLHFTDFLLHLSRAWGHAWHFPGVRLEEVTPFLLPPRLRFLPCRRWGYTSVKGLFEVLENTLEIQWGSLGPLQATGPHSGIYFSPSSHLQI